MIRPATVADARAIAEVAHRAWWREHADEPPETSLDEHVARWEHHLTLPARRRSSPTSAAASTASSPSAPSRIPDAPDDEGELMSLYVDPPAQGAGVGTALLAAAEDALREAGYTQAVVDVLDATDAARAFYERFGWAA